MEKTSKFAPLIGIVFSALLLVGMFIDNTPNSNDPAKWSTFFASHSNEVRMLLQGYLLILAGLALVGFLCVLRERMDGKMPTFAFVSGAIASAGICIGGGLSASVAGSTLFGNGPKFLPSGDLVNYISGTGWAVLLASAMLPLAFCMFSLGAAVIRTQALAAWIGYFALLTGVALLFAVIWLPLLILVAFTAIVGGVLTGQGLEQKAGARSAAY
jgi:hypothetical protein